MLHPNASSKTYVCTSDHFTRAEMLHGIVGQISACCLRQRRQLLPRGAKALTAKSPRHYGAHAFTSGVLLAAIAFLSNNTVTCYEIM